MASTLLIRNSLAPATGIGYILANFFEPWNAEQVENEHSNSYDSFAKLILHRRCSISLNSLRPSVRV